MTRRALALSAIAAAVAASIAIFGRSPKAAAATRVPSDPTEVLATVDGRGEPLRRALAANPRDLGAAALLARVDIQRAREEADPRYLGHAQAALAPWWNDEAAPPVVLVLRATIEQSLHDFDSALIHLDQALAKAPDDLQGWLTRAVILTVRGRYDEARTSCAHVNDTLARTICETQLDSLTGHARAAHDRLAAAPFDRGGDTEEWAVSSLGEYAARFGDRALAETYFRRALALSPNDAYVRAALGDRLIDQKRFADAVAIVAGHENDDGLLLRLAIAERRGRMPHASAHIAMLEGRFAASRARGDVVHRREEARFWLELKDDRERALELARANWDVQREPWDARILLAAGGREVISWLDLTKLEDPAITELR